ncbi:MAG: sugar dehydratase, partial [Blastocatellia bacterium]
LRQMGSTLSPEIRNEASNEIRHQYLSADKAHRLLNWTPAFNIDQGLKLTIDWYKEFLDHESKIK